MDTICVIACDDARVPFIDELGRHHAGRAAGRAADGKPAAETVPDTTYYRRAIGRGDLRLAPEAPSPVVPAEAPAGDPPAPTDSTSPDSPEGAAAPAQEI